jgi:hypothetical protein
MDAPLGFLGAISTVLTRPKRPRNPHSPDHHEAACGGSKKENAEGGSYPSASPGHSSSVQDAAWPANLDGALLQPGGGPLDRLSEERVSGGNLCARPELVSEGSPRPGPSGLAGLPFHTFRRLRRSSVHSDCPGAAPMHWSSTTSKDGVAKAWSHHQHHAGLTRVIRTKPGTLATHGRESHAATAALAALAQQ